MYYKLKLEDKIFDNIAVDNVSINENAGAKEMIITIPEPYYTDVPPVINVDFEVIDDDGTPYTIYKGYIYNYNISVTGNITRIILYKNK